MNTPETSTNSESRRNFIKKTLTGTALLTVGGILPGFSAKSYGRILGANEKVRLGVMGVNSRGYALASNFALQPNCEVVSISDVDSRAAEKCIKAVEKFKTPSPKTFPTFGMHLKIKA